MMDFLLAHVNVGWFGQFFFLRLLARVHPHLDADPPVGGQRFCGSVVNHRTQGVARDAAFDLPLTAGHFSPGQAATDLNLDALRALAQSLGNGTLHGTAVPNTALQLPHDIFGDQLGVQVGLFDLLNLDLDLLAGLSFQVLPDFLNGFALAPDNNAGLGREDGHDDLLRETLYLDLRDACILGVFRHHLPDHEVFMQVVRIAASLRKPARFPGAVDFQPEADGVNFTTHSILLCSSLTDARVRRE